MGTFLSSNTREEEKDEEEDSPPSPDLAPPRKGSSLRESKRRKKKENKSCSHSNSNGGGDGEAARSGGNSSQSRSASSQSLQRSSDVAAQGDTVRVELSKPSTSLVPTQSSKEATQTLFKHFQEVVKSHPEKEGFKVELENGSIYKWIIHFSDFPPESQIAQDLKMYHEARPDRSTVCIEAIFPPNYPSAPPFMRIIYPRFHQYTGHITIGGSICVKELTLSGWSSEFRLTQFAIMIRNLLIDGGALVDMTDPSRDYSEREAQEAFHRVASQHGWKSR